MIAHMLPALALAAAMTCEAAPNGSAIQYEPEFPIIGAPPPEPVELGVDCTKPFTVSLPDDVLTECE